nr:LOW QUALITY PROTEIN: transcription factor grauzone [Aedes albopictus]
MSDSVENCLTCRRKPDQMLRFTDRVNGEDIGAVVASHFWFQVDQYEGRVLCNICWDKIEDFHKFYCEVKHLWDEDVLSSCAAVKMERDDDDEELVPSILFACDLIKEEAASNQANIGDTGNSLVEAEENDEVVKDQATDESDEDSTLPIAKRCRRRKAKDSTVAVVPKKRGRPLGKKQSVVPTTQKKPTTRKKIDLSLQCELCDDSIRVFKRHEALQMHKLVKHSEQLEKKFSCDLCDRAYAYDWQLSGHKSWHQKEALNICCNICNKHFYSGRTLNNHMQANHPESVTQDGTSNDGTSDRQRPPVAPKGQPLNVSLAFPTPSEEVMNELIRKFCPLICDKCGFLAETFFYLKQHFRQDHQNHVYALCCDKKFFKKRLLYDHCLRHENPDVFRCELCQKSFTEKEGLERHNAWVHTPDSEKPYKCDICDAAFPKEYLLIPHMRYHLSMEQKHHVCDECGKAFGTENNLRQHQQTVHGPEYKLVCDICAKGFINKTLFDAHLLTHTEEGAASLKQQCPHCKRWLKNRSSFNRHKWRCMADGTVTCDVCGKEAANKDSLASHKRLHHSDHPGYKCSFCGKGFKRAIRHREHEANHRGEVLYQCQFCPYSCNSNSNMYTHKKAVHAELWEEVIANRFYKR